MRLKTHWVIKSAVAQTNAKATELALKTDFARENLTAKTMN